MFDTSDQQGCYGALSRYPNLGDTLAKLTQTTGNGSGRVINLQNGTWRIGRHSANDFMIDHPSVSLFHAEFKVREIGVSFQDIGSTNGSFLNSERFVHGMIGDRQVLKLGVIEFLVEIPQSIIQPIRAPTIEQKHANFLNDGTPACQNHPEQQAEHRCSKCEETFCDQCVRRTGLVGRASLVFCPSCSGKCGSELSKDSRKNKKSLLARIAHALYLTRQKNR